MYLIFLTVNCYKSHRQNDMNILFICKSKYNIQIKSYDNYFKKS